MTESIDVSSKLLEYSSLFQSKSPASESKIAEKSPGKSDGKGVVAKNQIENYIKNSTSETTENGSSDHLKELDDDEYNYVIYGSKKEDPEIKIGKNKKDSHIFSYGSKESNNSDVELLQGDISYSIMNSYGALAAAVGANSMGVSKLDLITYLQKLSSGSEKNTNDSEVIAFLKSLIAQFDTLSGGEEYITSLTGIKEPQDYSTVTKEQVTPPVDLRI